jgi:hypothetical protein
MVINKGIMFITYGLMQILKVENHELSVGVAIGGDFMGLNNILININ